MNVRDIMSKRVITVEMDDKLSTVKEIFDNLHFHHLLVIEDDKLLGVVSDRTFSSAQPQSWDLHGIVQRRGDA